MAFRDVPRKSYEVAEGISLSVAELGPPDGLPVIFCHGFPDLWTVWHKQMQALAAQGYHAIAPSMRGYNDSYSPDDVSRYAPELIVQDLVGLLDAMKIERAVFVGHDWGAVPVWAISLAHPDRVIAMSSFCVPPFGLPNKMLEDPIFTYQKYFQLNDRQNAIKELEYHPARVFVLLNDKSSPEAYERKKRIFRADVIERGGLLVNEPDDVSDIDTTLSKEELQYLVATFKKSGFATPLAWYCQGKAIGNYWQKLGTKYTKPTLLVLASQDYVLQPRFAEGAEQIVQNLTRKTVDAGHFLQREKPEEVNQILLEWLQQVAPTAAGKL